MAKTDPAAGDPLRHLDHRTVLARILDTGLMGALLISLDGQVIFANEACCRIVGRETAEVVARNIDELLHPDDRATSRHDLDALTTNDAGNLDFERRYVRRDGRTAWAKGSVSLLRDTETSEPLMLAYLLSDITSVKETALAKERLHLTLQSMGDAVICTDIQSLVTFMNPVAERLTGWTAADAAGKPAAEVFSLVDERSGRPPVSPIDQCMEQRGTLMCEGGMILLSRTGDAFDIGLSAAPLRSNEAILGSVVVFNDLTKINADRRKVARSALHDGLTGLPNRGAFIEKLAVALGEARDEGRAHALCFIDLDRFKMVNDRAGHAAGDALLSHVAKIIALSCSSKDVPARLGGDEFAVLIRDCTASEAERTASEIVHAIGNIEFRWETQLFRIGASIGATMITDASACLEDMLHEADQACYRAKHSGRGQVFIHNPKHKAVGRGSDPHPSKWLNIH
jgi:diguanylate cyclase (GGDEF)-like protein/PAS domain S-box-containing protein